MWVRCTREGSDFVRLEVQDTGIGIRPGDYGRLFVEFQQLDASTAKRYQGTGLGLALTKRLAEAQGGRVEVRSTLGEGSTFAAILPRVLRLAEVDALTPVAWDGVDGDAEAAVAGAAEASRGVG